MRLDSGIIVLLSMAVLYGCAKKQDPLFSQGQEILFGPSVIVGGHSAETKAPLWPSSDISSFSLGGAYESNGFGVFACTTGEHTYRDVTVTANFMCNQQVVFNDGNWMYSPVKYWPNGSEQKLSFFAYAPYSDGDETSPLANPVGYCIPSFSLPQDTGDPWVLYRLHPQMDKQVDLLYAAPLLNQMKLPLGRRLSFEFRHALAQIGNVITVKCGDELKEDLRAEIPTVYDRVVLKVDELKVTYTLTSKARLVLWTSEETANWESVESETVLTTREVTLISDSATLYEYDYSGGDPTESAPVVTIDDKACLFIPLELDGFPQKAEFSVSLTAEFYQGLFMETKAGENKKSFLIKSLFYEAAEDGKILDMNLTIDKL